MGDHWNKFREKLTHLQGDLVQFKVDFLDINSFKDFVDNLWRTTLQNYPEICMTGYFSETIREKLEYLMNWNTNVRLISPELPSRASKRDRRNLEVLKKLVNTGVKIKFNHRTHARLLIAYNPKADYRGLVIIGSFDFNSECIGKERYDSGIKTRHPDLVKSAIKLFEQIWNEPESISLEEYIEKRIK